jgi:hypothetical protein
MQSESAAWCWGSRPELATTLTSNGSASGLPEPATRVGAEDGGAKAGRWVVSLEEPTGLSALEWVARNYDLKTPTLILHGIENKSMPVAG